MGQPSNVTSFSPWYSTLVEQVFGALCNKNRPRLNTLKINLKNYCTFLLKYVIMHTLNTTKEETYV